jgi:hypothetical protein
VTCARYRKVQHHIISYICGFQKNELLERRRMVVDNVWGWEGQEMWVKGY